MIFLFWLFIAFNSTITLRTKLIFHIIKKEHSVERKLLKLTDLDLVLFYIYYFLTLASLILSTISEKYIKNSSNESSEESSNLLSRLTFFWINPLIEAGYKRDLVREDLWKISDKELSQSTSNKLELFWNLKANNYIKRMRELNTNNRKEYQPSLTMTIIEIYFGKFIGILAIKLTHDLLNFVRPILLDKLILFIIDKEQKLIVGLFYIFILFLSSIMQTLILQHYHHGTFIMGNRIKIGLMNLIYKKSLRLSNTSRQKTNIGEMTNLITSNTKTFEHCANLLTDLISVPFQIAICAYLLYNYIGISALIGLSTMALFIPSNICFVYLGRKIRFKKHKLQDSRIKMMIEILNGIRVIKFYGWEVSVKNIIENLRMKEITNLIKSSLLNAFTSFTWNSAPIIVACSSFATYLFINRQVYFLNFTKKILFYNLF